MMKRFCSVLLFALAMSVTTKATDIQVFPQSSAPLVLNNLVWGQAGPQGFNNNYFFVPKQPNVCVWVENNNPTNPHTFTASIVITPDSDETTPSDGSWHIAGQSTNLFAATAPGLNAGLGANIAGSAVISINLSASSTQAGSPDTANVHIVQSAVGCFSGGQFIGSAPQTVMSIPQFQANSDGLSQSFTASTSIASPALGTDLLTVNVNNGGRTIYFDRVILGTTSASAIQINILPVNTTGSTCTSATGANAKIGSTLATTTLDQFSCTTHPVQIPGTQGLSPIVPAAGTTTIDLRGFIAPAGTTFGLNIQNLTAITGSMNVSFFWTEK